MTNSISEDGSTFEEPIAHTNRLYALVLQRFRILQNIHQLIQNQAETVGLDDINLFIGFLSRKDSLLEELVIVDSQLKPYQFDNAEVREWDSPEKRRECRQLSEQGNRLLADIIRLEEFCLTEVSSRRDAVAAQLKDGTDSVLARSAYTAGDTLDHGSLDLCNL